MIYIAAASGRVITDACIDTTSPPSREFGRPLRKVFLRSLFFFSRPAMEFLRSKQAGIQHDFTKALAAPDLFIVDEVCCSIPTGCKPLAHLRVP